MPKIQPCTTCGHPTRPKQTPLAMAPGTKTRIGGLCFTCHDKARPTSKATGTPLFPIIDCRVCKRPTRSKKEHPDNAPGTLVRYGADRCSTCVKKLDVPQADIQHTINGLNAWLEERRKRVGVTA